MKVLNQQDDFKLAIEFNRAECEVLMTIATKVGGPIESPGDGHRVTDELLKILRNNGIKREIEIDWERSGKGTIYFK